jgi:hypothetical protein
MNEISIGDKVKFIGVRSFWFVDMIENGKKLGIGEVYTISEVTEASSWTGVKLRETEELRYNLSWFDKV